MTAFPFANAFPNAAIICVGDVMLDHFYSGEALRISPEAPVPVLKVLDKFSNPGGAANTAMNIACLGSKVRLVAPVGDDEAGRDLRNTMGDRFPITLDSVSDDRGTIVKSRYSAQGQQLLRIDSENTSPLPAKTTQALLTKVQEGPADAQLIVLSDYAKGVLTTELCQGLIAWARANDVPIVVDPKGSDFSKYAGATILTPNELELSVVAGRRAASEEDIIEDALTLIRTHGFTWIAVTRGKSGVMLVDKNGLVDHVPSFARDVFDVSGAGDSFVAGLACSLAGGRDVVEAVHYGNAVAGVAVGKSGTAMVSRDEVENLVRERMRAHAVEITTDYAEMGRQIKNWQDEGLKVGLTNGVFDLLHLGHLRILNESKSACDKLVVAINSDTSVKRLKGDLRPIQADHLRAAVLASLKQVDLVVIFDEDTPIDVIRAKVPDILVKGGDYIADQIVGYTEVTGAGGDVLIVPTLHGYSTTATVQKISAADV